MWRNGHTTPQLSASHIPTFLSAALAAIEYEPHFSFPISWPDCVAAWCKCLTASDAKAEAGTLAKQAHERCHARLGRNHADTKGCKKLRNIYA